MTKTCRQGHEVTVSVRVSRCPKCVRDQTARFERNRKVLTKLERRELRAVLAFQAMLLRAWGHDVWEVAAALGMQRSGAGELISDPSLTTRRKRMATYGGECKVCGGPTAAPHRKSDGPPRLCKWCVQGLERPRPAPEALVSRSLLDVDLLERAEKAWELCVRANTPEERLDLLAAVVWPSDQRHLVAA